MRSSNHCDNRDLFAIDQVNLYLFCSVRRNMELDQQRLVFDCSFDNAMTSREIQETAQQLSRVYSRNRDHLEPYVLHLCNLNRSVRHFPEIL